MNLLKLCFFWLKRWLTPRFLMGNVLSTQRISIDTIDRLDYKRERISDEQMVNLRNAWTRCNVWFEPMGSLIKHGDFLKLTFILYEMFMMFCVCVCKNTGDISSKIWNSNIITSAKVMSSPENLRSKDLQVSTSEHADLGCRLWMQVMDMWNLNQKTLILLYEHWHSASGTCDLAS